MNDNLKKLFRSASRRNRKFVSEILNERKINGKKHHLKKIYLRVKREKQAKLSGQRLGLILYLGQIRNFELLLKFMLAKTLKISL